MKQLKKMYESIIKYTRGNKNHELIGRINADNEKITGKYIDRETESEVKIEGYIRKIDIPQNKHWSVTKLTMLTHSKDKTLDGMLLTFQKHNGYDLNGIYKGKHGYSKNLIRNMNNQVTAMKTAEELEKMLIEQTTMKLTTKSYK